MESRVITFSKNVFLPLTTVCHNRCGYCCFRTTVRNGCVMTPPEVRQVLRQGQMLGCKEALFTFGERPGLEPGFLPYIRKTGYNNILEYCYEMCKTTIECGLLPHTNAGVLTYQELERLKEVNASMGLMLETTADVPAHSRSPGKTPSIRIETIENAGKLQIPFTTGLLLGIGETMEDREESLSVIAALHRRYDHIQEVIIQNFCPKAGTPMEDVAPVPSEEICLTIRMARDILPGDIAIQIPPNLADARMLIQCGVDDLGGVSPFTLDYVNPEHPWPQIDELRDLVGDAILRERLCIYPEFIEKGWYPAHLESLIKRLEQQLLSEGGLV
jgi:FO synthase subunit 1